ncbi:M20 peptidase aminoacylase family protein [Evansella clarkii]|uniref:M20 peptidase aminoacylase family protein n=1 Tax=Evansella clarkii TaxID=79879 RepID=UPI000998D63E|nr:M20 peptidase aminoacylase family protein [Evansella clarkii]
MENIIDGIKKEVLDIFDHLHQNPEVSWKETETTKFLARFLEEKNAKVRLFKNSTGVIGEIGEGSPVVAVRADIDALWQEVDGTFQANHSCGHDAHMAIAAGVLSALLKVEDRPEGTVRFIFQPAEEKGTGALKMVEEGVVDDVDYLYGIHLRPENELPEGLAAPAILHGAAKFMLGKIKGDDAHGARPHLGSNAIETGVSLVNMINGIHLNPMDSYSAKMTSFHAGGESANIIPGSASFSIDLRAQKNETMELLEEKIHAATENLASYYGTEITLETGANIAAAESNEEAITFMSKGITSVLGGDNLQPPIVTTGGDDFHFYTIKRPHLKATMLGLGCGLTPGLHHPAMTFNKEALFDGIHILTATVIKTLEEGSVSLKNE